MIALPECILGNPHVTYRNGRSVSLQSRDGGWTCETHLTDYVGDGTRRDLAISEASDLAWPLTNRITRYDFLGRPVATLTPGAGGAWLTAASTYEGATTRLLRSEATGRPAVTYLRDALGEPAGTVQSGITTAVETRYETISNEVWRVTAQSTFAGGVTSAVTATRQQMTGLSDALRSRMVAIAPGGSATTSESAFNPATSTLTTTTRTDGGTPVVRRTRFGALVETRSLAEHTVRYHDAFLTPYHVRTFHPVTGGLRSRHFLGLDEATWDPVYTEIRHGSLTVAGTAQFDAFGRETARTDALGGTVATTHDVLGRRAAVAGATYPLRNAYDSAGRATSLATTRDGAAWDTTRWVYDTRTGLATSKLYADNSAVMYSHTPDGKPLRTTWARGEWRENSYNADGLPATITYSDATPAVALAYDTFLRLAAVSNAAAVYAYANDLLGAATNEISIIGDRRHTVTRRFDNRHRLASLGTGDATVYYACDTENRLASVSNDAFAVAYAYTSDGWDAGYTIVLSGGTVISRALTRDNYRRGLVTAIANTVNGAVVGPLAYSYDVLNRVTRRNNDAFGYNTRSEVTSATVQPAHTNRYEFDGIGNKRWTSVNSATNFYSANELNQYTRISNGSLSEPEYDLDGNMIWDGRFQYTWDAENRLLAVYSNITCVVSNAYDHASRRVAKWTPSRTTTFVYDGWNLVQETISTASGVTTNAYVWGKDLSGTLQGAGGVGGLLAVSMNGAWHFPFYDNNGNVTAYVNEQGTVVAEYIYDAFGRTIAQTGPMADAFPHRFSTKYFDAETGLYYYGYRFYSPALLRWLNRDPVSETGGMNLYAFCRNNGIAGFDPLGLYEKVALGTGVGFSVSYGGQGQPQFSAMLVGSLKQSPCENLRFNADVGIRLMRGGAIGGPRDSADWTYEVFGSISGTIGKGNGKSVPFYFNGTQWGSALGDTYGSSLSVGQTLYYNSALKETPRMGLVRLQSGGAFLNYHNDQWEPPYGLGDGNDRGWTGGGALGFSIGDGKFAMAGFDAFTGRAAGTRYFDTQNPNIQTPESQSLNQAQWSMGVSGSACNLFGASIAAPDHFNVQHWIHSTISPAAGYFDYPQEIQFRLRMSGFILKSERE